MLTFRRSLHVAATLLLAMFATSLAARADDLAGHVVDFDGKPIAGATVLVSTAAPRVGVSVYCPSCYADCGKRATTDADGTFEFRNLDPTLIFRLVAAAEGHRARNSDPVDPAKDKPSIRLEPLPENLEPDHVVRGRVVDTDGKPVVGAQVTPDGCKQGERRWWGQVRDADPLTVTGTNGEFLLTATSAADAYDLTIRSPRHAPKAFPLVPTGDTVHELAVETGSIVRGQLLAAGKPVEGIELGLVQTDRGSESFLGEHKIGTRADGSFEFTYVPDDDNYYIYTTMSSAKSSSAGQGSLPLRRVSIEDGKPVIELGELELGPTVSLAGRIELTDGKPVPGPLQLLITREGAWDSQTTTIQSDGAFHFDNIPGNEPLTFVARVPGYHLSDRTRFQQIRENSIAMFVESPRDDIVIYYEPDPPTN